MIKCDEEGVPNIIQQISFDGFKVSLLIYGKYDSYVYVPIGTLLYDGKPVLMRYSVEYGLEKNFERKKLAFDLRSFGEVCFKEQKDEIIKRLEKHIELNWKEIWMNIRNNNHYHIY